LITVPPGLAAFAGLGIFKIPASKPNVLLLLGLRSVKSSGVFVTVFIYETVLLKKLFEGRIAVPPLFVAPIVDPLICRKSPEYGLSPSIALNAYLARTGPLGIVLNPETGIVKLFVLLIILKDLLHLVLILLKLKHSPPYKYLYPEH
jgi:hypothetical protein